MQVLLSSYLKKEVSVKKIILFSILFVSSVQVFSEDIELYLLDSTTREQSQPQVLLIFDTSGSMHHFETIKTPFDKDASYEVQSNGFADTSNEYLYYVVDSSSEHPTVDSSLDLRRFNVSLNNCFTSKSRLDEVGFYTGRIRQYALEGSVGSWQKMPSVDGRDIELVDCEDDTNIDIENDTTTHDSNTISGTEVKGYPIDGVADVDTGAPIQYSTNVAASDVNWSGQVVTLYTEEFLRWSQGTNLVDSEGTVTAIGTSEERRINIAKRAVRDLINSTPSVKFGLEVFNFDVPSSSNDSATPDIDESRDFSPVPDGGRIGFSIQNMTDSARKSLQDMIKDDIHYAGATPLCESYYEAYRYLAGLPPVYGQLEVDAYDGYNKVYNYKDLPAMDPSSISSTTVDETVVTNYVSPFSTGGCSNQVFVILITDGTPVRDEAADDTVTALAASASPVINTDIKVAGNYLPVLAEYMNKNDINTDRDGVQTAVLHTVGFSSDSSGATTLLESAADHGGGEYYDATDPAELGAKLIEAVSSILSINTSFTAPSVATSAFDRTETLDSIYYGMFVPSDRARWSGNLKKLKIGDDGNQKDRDGDNAITAAGSIDPQAKTFWSTSSTADGNDATQGGVVEMFSNKRTVRKLYIDKTDNELVELDFQNIFTSTKTAFSNSEAELNTALGVTNSADATAYLTWAMGVESSVTNTTTDGGSGTTETTTSYGYRADLFGDPLHSKPVVINYGGDSEDEQDLRILVGTNAGALHMFKDSGDTVDESWAFMPKGLFKNIKTLRDNLPSSSKVYGVDGRITSFVVDKDGNGKIEAGTDTALAFFGLRRGGNEYYGMDLTNPNAPALLWKIKGTEDGDFKELGQTWSQPQVGYSSFNRDIDGNLKPVLIFGAGYAILKDADSVGQGEDPVGRGVFMVDAMSGELVWSMTPGDTIAGKNTQFTGFTDSIPSKVAILDSDGDGLMDRLYTGDTGGNVFRIDMPGSDPFSTTTPWTAFKLAELGNATESPKTNLNDRRFFNAPSIVRTFFTDTVETTVGTTTTITRQERPYEAIMIGSGDRTSPTDTKTNDEFFLIQDENIFTQSFKDVATATIKKTPVAITYDNLLDFTNNPYGSTETENKQFELDITNSSGWRYNFGESGEKSTAGAFAVNGVAYFTSFTPGEVSADVCELVDGVGRLHAIDLYKGTNKYSWRELITYAGMPDTPVLSRTPNTSGDGDGGEPDPDETHDRTNDLNLHTSGISIPIDSGLLTLRPYQYVSEQSNGG